MAQDRVVPFPRTPGGLRSSTNEATDLSGYATDFQQATTDRGDNSDAKLTAEKIGAPGAYRDFTMKPQAPGQKGSTDRASW
jgi:hypothetical protein